MKKKNNMGDLANICTAEADRARFLKALRKLKEAGVTLIDDQEGRPRVIGKAPSPVSGDTQDQPELILTTEELLLDRLEAMFEIQDNADRDPYNKKP